MSGAPTAREIAHAYLRRGWAPIPVPFKAKKPGIDGWQKLRLTDAQIDNAFPRDSMNVSVLLGVPSGGLADVDLDNPLAVLLAGRFLPRTAAIFGRASARRSHHLYRITGSAKTTSWEDPIVDKDDPERGMLLEFRFSGHTVFPGSTHPSGEAITWDAEGEPLVIPAATLLPRLAWLAAVVLLARHWPGRGNRHKAALALAGGLLRAGWPSDEVEVFVRAVADGAGDEEAEDRIQAVASSSETLATGQLATGWPTLADLVDNRVVAKVMAWLGIAAESSSGDWPEPTPLPDGHRPAFPADDYPPTLRLFVSALAIATQTPLALAALLVLAVLAAAAASRVVVRVRDGWKEPVNLFVAVALGPANRKSAVFSECSAPLERFEQEEIARLAPELAQRQSALKIKKKQLDALEKKAAAIDDRVAAEDLTKASERAHVLARELAETPIPEPPRLMVDDCSPEMLAKLLATQDGRIAVMSPEGGVFGMMGGRYSANSQPNLDVYLKGHAGDPLRVDRIGRPPDIVPHPALTIGLAVQPGVIRQLAEKPEFRERGLPARFLYGMPVTWVGKRLIAAPPVPETVRAAYHRCVRAVLELPRFKGEDGHALPKELRLSDEASTAFVEFEIRLEPRLGEHGDLGHVADWAGKLAGATARIAGLLHLSEHAAGKAPWDTPIAGETMDAAIRLSERFFVPHALTAFAAMGADPNLEAARKLLGWVERRATSSFSLRDAHQDLRKHQLSTGQLERAAALLVEHGHLRPAPLEPKPATGRPPSPRYLVHPRVAAQNPPKAQNPGDEPGPEDFEGNEVCMDINSTEHGWGCEPYESFEDASPMWEEVEF